MKIIISVIGATRTKYIQEGIDIYLGRLRHYIPTEIAVVPDIKATKSLTEIKQKEMEGQQLLQSLQPGDFLCLLDERGKEMTSRIFSSWLETRMASGIKRLVFAIGGPYGFSEQVYARADAKISLSQMTFNHEMVRLFLVEQIYRGLTILRGEPYHHD